MYVYLNPPALPGYQVLVGAVGCLEQTNSLGNLKTGTHTWSPQGHHNINYWQFSALPTDTHFDVKLTVLMTI